jgi:hypothetical protein
MKSFFYFFVSTTLFFISVTALGIPSSSDSSDGRIKDLGFRYLQTFVTENRQYMAEMESEERLKKRYQTDEFFYVNSDRTSTREISDFLQDTDFEEKLSDPSHPINRLSTFLENEALKMLKTEMLLGNVALDLIIDLNQAIDRADSHVKPKSSFFRDAIAAIDSNDLIDSKTKIRILNGLVRYLANEYSYSPNNLRDAFNAVELLDYALKNSDQENLLKVSSDVIRFIDRSAGFHINIGSDSNSGLLAYDIDRLRIHLFNSLKNNSNRIVNAETKASLTPPVSGTVAVLG